MCYVDYTEQPDGSVSAQLLNPAVTEEILRKIVQWNRSGLSNDGIINSFTRKQSLWVTNFTHGLQVHFVNVYINCYTIECNIALKSIDFRKGRIKPDPRGPSLLRWSIPTVLGSDCGKNTVR